MEALTPLTLWTIFSLFAGMNPMKPEISGIACTSGQPTGRPALLNDRNT